MKFTTLLTLEFCQEVHPKSEVGSGFAGRVRKELKVLFETVVIFPLVILCPDCKKNEKIFTVLQGNIKDS